MTGTTGPTDDTAAGGVIRRARPSRAKRKPTDPLRTVDLPQEWIQRHIDRLSRFHVVQSVPVSGWQRRRAHYDRAGYRFVDPDWTPIEIGDTWGDPTASTEFLRAATTVPAGFDDGEAFLEIDLDGGETQVSINGVRVQGLDRFRSLVPLGPVGPGDELAIELEAFIINHPYDRRAGDERYHHRFARARFIRLDPVVGACLADLRFVLDAYLDLWNDDVDLELESFLLHHLMAATRRLGPSFDSADQARDVARQTSKLLHDTVFASTVYRRPGTISVYPNSHLDLAYLWPLHETVRKGARTTTNMLSLMSEFDDFTFGQSQLWLYESLEQSYPDVFARVRRRIDEGRWEVIGAMYVEPDANLISGESLVRQLLFGKTYARRHLGVDPTVAWLPDVFGLGHTLPQILRQAGVRYFMTPKLQIFNDTNRQPHDSFRWRGPDGSEVIAHCPPSHFAQPIGFGELRRHRAAQTDKWTSPETMFLYGWGDGGGGPTREMVEAGRRARNFPGLAACTPSSAEDFFERLAQHETELPVWDDELYLEEHRGTYTSKGELKKANREAELLFRDAEIVSVLAGVVGGGRVQDRLNDGWRLVLVNQFHDVLPGSHIAEVTAEALNDYERAVAIGRSVRDDALATIGRAATSSSDEIVIVNTLGWTRTDLVELPTERGDRFDLGDSRSAIQVFGRHRYALAADVPSLGWAVGRVVDDPGRLTTPVARADGVTAETASFRIEFGDDGSMTRIVDKDLERDLLTDPGNVLQVFEDDPGQRFSAWDLTERLETYQYPVRQVRPWTLVSNGPLFAVLSGAWSCLGSEIEQELWLYGHSRRIDFKTRVEWRASNKLLKVAFPLAVRARHATYDTAFGTIDRPTHRNTSWDAAKYEVCAHKWADLSQNDVGVALLNDGKYGHDARENVLRLSLLRTSTYPDPESDIGTHEFTYSLFPHEGSWRDAQVDRRAYELNVPLVSTTGHHEPGGTIDRFSLLAAESRGVVIDTVKQAEDGSGVIVRCYDAHGRAETVRCRSDAELAAVAATNLLEEYDGPVELDSPHSYTISTRPYGIVTLRHDMNTIGGET